LEPCDAASGRCPMKWGSETSTTLGQANLAAYVGLVPVGATEQHGPHLPTDTDTRVASALCDAVAGAVEKTIVLPPIAVGCSLGHGTTFPGTLSLFPEELARILFRYAEWSAHSGLTRLIFVNAHMGNVGSLSIATDRLRFLRPDLQSGWVDWWHANADVREAVAADGEDIHANRAETSIMLHIAPESVDVEAMSGADDIDRTDGLTFRYTAAALSRNGVTGRPSEATAEQGRALFEAVVDVIAAKARAGLSEKPPL
jgi:creatinine amidohydrolase